VSFFLLPVGNAGSWVNLLKKAQLLFENTHYWAPFYNQITMILLFKNKPSVVILKMLTWWNFYISSHLAPDSLFAKSNYLTRHGCFFLLSAPIFL